MEDIDAHFVAINWTYRWVDFDTVFTADPDIVENPVFADEVYRATLDSREAVIAPGTPTRITGAIHCERRISGGLSDDPKVLHTTGSSGYAAINLAYLKRAKRIYLLGFNYDRFPFTKWVNGYETMLPQLEAAGVQVVNCNPDSQLPFFRKVRWECQSSILRMKSYQTL